MKGTQKTVAVTTLKLAPRRTDHGTDDELKALARSWLACQIHPIVARPDMTVADGTRRVMGCGLVGVEEIPVLVTDEDLTDADLDELALASAMHRRDLSPFEQARIGRDWMAKSNATAAELAAKVQLSEGHVSKLLSLWKTTPAVVRAAAEGRIGVRVWHHLSTAAEEDQAGMLDQYLSGESEGDVRAAVRAKRPQPAAKLARVSVPLPTGAKVVVSGTEMTLDDVIAALAAAVELARKAGKESLDVRTAEKVWRDRARAR